MSTTGKPEKRTSARRRASYPTLERNQTIYRRRMEGERFSDLAREYHITRGRVAQIFARQEYDLYRRWLAGEKFADLCSERGVTLISLSRAFERQLSAHCQDDAGDDDGQGVDGKGS